MSVHNIKQFNDYSRRVLSAPDLLRTLVSQEAAAAATEMEKDRADKFDRGQSPYGERWPRRKVPRPWPILNRTGRLRASFQRQVQGQKVVFDNAQPYAKRHQEGTRHMPKRQILPEPKKGLPPSWTTMLAQRVHDKLALLLGKAA